MYFSHENYNFIFIFIKRGLNINKKKTSPNSAQTLHLVYCEVYLNRKVKSNLVF